MNAKQRRRVRRAHIGVVSRFVDVLDGTLERWGEDSELTKADVLAQLSTLSREFKETFGKDG